MGLVFFFLYRLHRYICACQSRHLLGDCTASSPDSDGSGDSGDGESSSGTAAPSSAAAAAGAQAAGGESGGGGEARYRDVVRELTTQYR